MADDVLGVPFLCDVATILGALGELDLAGQYVDRAAERNPVFPGQVLSTAFVLDARKGILGDLDEGLANTLPAAWWRVKLVAALATARGGDLDRAAPARRRSHIASSSRWGSATSPPSARAGPSLELQAALQRAGDAAARRRRQPAPPRRRRGAGRRLVVMGEPISVHEGAEVTVVPPGNPQRLVGVLVANGGSVTIDQLSEALWPGEEIETSRSRLRNVLLRLRRAVGDVVNRTGSGLRLTPGLPCDLHEFQRQAADALAAARADPGARRAAGGRGRRAGRRPDLRRLRVRRLGGRWPAGGAEQQLISLLDLLSVQAEDAGDLPVAQALAERALRLDRYTDSRYVRLAELLTLQNRVAAAIAVLDDAAEVARDLGDGTPGATKHRRDELLRRTATGV